MYLARLLKKVVTKQELNIKDSEILKYLDYHLIPKIESL